MKYCLMVGNLFVKKIDLVGLELVKYKKFALEFDSKYEALDLRDELKEKWRLNIYVSEKKVKVFD